MRNTRHMIAPVLVARTGQYPRGRFCLPVQTGAEMNPSNRWVGEAHQAKRGRRDTRMAPMPGCPMNGNPAPFHFTSAWMLLGGCYRCMCLKKFVNMAQRLGDLFLGFLPGVDADFGIRRELR